VARRVLVRQSAAERRGFCRPLGEAAHQRRRGLQIHRLPARSEPVPAAVIDRLVGKWEAPDPTEAHTVDWLSTV
jgi:hypothetical protein